MKNFLKNNNLILFFIGLITSFSFAPFFLIFIPFFSFPYLFDKVFHAKNKFSSFLIGFIFSFGYFIGNLYWMSISLFTDIKTYWWLLPFAISVIPACVAIFLGISCLCFYIFKTKSTTINVILFASFWTIFEYLRSVMFTGLPWNLPVNCITFSKILIQPISILNSYGYSFVLMLLFLSKKFYKEKFFKFFIIFFIGLLIFSFVRIKITGTKNKEINIRIIQPNIPQVLKWNKDVERENFEKIINLSLSKDYEKVDYFIWPESAITGVYYEKRDNSKLVNEINDRLLKDKKTLISGIVSYDEEKLFNSLIILNGNKVSGIYRKYFLVPFGEFIPLRKFFPFVSKITAGSLDYSRGKARQNLTTKDFVFSPNICYESIFFNSINKNSNLIINITNDGWFGKSTGPFQHFEHLKLRAVENNLPVIRVANSGISGVISNFGETIIKTKLYKEEVIDIKLPYSDKKTKKISEGFIIIVLILINLVLIASFHYNTIMLKFNKM